MKSGMNDQRSDRGWQKAKNGSVFAQAAHDRSCIICNGTFSRCYVVRWLNSALQSHWEEYFNGATAIILSLCGGAFIGAGVFYPFKRPYVGCMIGLVLHATLAAMNWFALGIAGSLSSG